MRHPILTIFKKELARFFGDKRMVVSILLPGIMIYVLYSLMGSAMSGMYTVDEDYTYEIRAVHLPESIAALSDAVGLEITELAAEDAEAAKTAIEEQSGMVDALLVFPEDFDAQVENYSLLSSSFAPEIQVYYNSVDTNSGAAYDAVTALLDGYEDSLSNKFDVNRTEETYDLASEEDVTGMLFASLLPMLLMMFLFSGCMAVAPESIAGEKERGTIATLLVTPVPRSSIALGKILALSIIALLSGTSSAVGTILSLPKLMGGMELSGSVYGISEYLMLAVVILATVLLLISLISIISAYAKTIKEAQTLMTPMMILVMVLGITAMFGNVRTDLIWYCIPLYNSVQCMAAIFSFQMQTAAMAITVVVNLIVAVAGVFVLTRMFRSEKVIFAR